MIREEPSSVTIREVHTVEVRNFVRVFHLRFWFCVYPKSSFVVDGSPEVFL